MTKKIVRDLVRMKILVEQGWCQQTYAQDQYGRDVAVSSQSACCWCLTGAAMKVTREKWTGLRNMLLFQYLQRATKHLDLVYWNDGKRRTQKQVLNAISKAIRFAEKDLRNGGVALTMS